jgi:lysozyme
MKCEELLMKKGYFRKTVSMLGSFVLILSMVLSLWNVSETTVSADVEDVTVQSGDHANSWRYQDGKRKEVSGKDGRMAARAARPWNATAVGIDVSKHNGDIDWEKVKNSGMADFAIIRCGYGMDETAQDDPKWEYNSSECERLGIPYGVYLYSYATDTEKAKSEARHVIRLLKGKTPSYPIYYDMEDKVQANLSSEKLGQIATAFLNTLEAAGYTNVGIYASSWWFGNKLTAPVFGQYPRWVAQYANSCTYSGSYHMWQHTSEGYVDGIGSHVDLNYKIGNWSKAGHIPSIYLNRKSISLKAGQKTSVKATCIFKNGYYSPVRFTSSKTSVAYVNSSGYITAKSAGKATITASLNNGRKAYCTVTVYPKTNRIRKLSRRGKNLLKFTGQK